MAEELSKEEEDRRLEFLRDEGFQVLKDFRDIGDKSVRDSITALISNIAKSYQHRLSSNITAIEKPKD